MANDWLKKSRFLIDRDRALLQTLFLYRFRISIRVNLIVIHKTYDTMTVEIFLFMVNFVEVFVTIPYSFMKKTGGGADCVTSSIFILLKELRS